MSHDVTLLKIDTDKPEEVQAVMLYGIRVGMENQRARDRRMRATAEADKQHAAALYLSAEVKEANGKRFYTAGIVVFIAAVGMFVAACMIGGK